MKLIASIFGIGYIKGGGTLAAIVAALVWYSIHPLFGIQLLLIGLITLVGIYSGNKVEADWGKDSSKVVIDEVAGMFLSLLLIPIHWSTILAALLLFRFFDIVKPLGVRRMEVFKGGWGVMADDLLAGVYANIVLQLLLQLHLFPETI